MNKKKAFAITALAFALGACGVTGSTQAIKPQEKTSGPFGMVRDADIKTETEKAFAGMNRVVVGSFKVAFIESKKEGTKAGRGVGGRASAGLTLVGLTPEVQQRVTEAAYADFVAQMRAAGYEVVDRATLLQSPDFAKADKQASPLKQEASFFGSSTEMTYVAPRSVGDLYFFMGETDKIGGFGFSNPTMAASGFADKNGVPVVSVIYTVDFAGADGHGGAFSSTAALQVGQGISVAPGSGVTLVGGTGSAFNSKNGSVKLGQPVYSTETFGEVVMTTSDAMKAVEVASNIAGALLGAGTNQRRDFDVRADPAKYETISTAVLKDTNARLVARMGSLR